MFAEKNRASFSVIKSPSVGYGADFVTCVIKLNFNGELVVFKQAGISGNNQIGLSFMDLEYEYKNSKNFSLSLSSRDFFSRLFFLGNLKTSSEQFDRKFVISTSNKFLANKIFGEKRVQELFLGNRLLLFNIQTKNGYTKVKFRSLERKLYSSDELQFLSNEFLYMIDKLH